MVRITGITIGLLAVLCNKNLLTSSVMFSLIYSTLIGFIPVEDFSVVSLMSNLT